MKQVVVRAGVAIGGAAAALGLGVAAAGPAFADLLPSPPAVLSPVTGLLATPSPSPFPSASPAASTLLSPVFQVLPSPVASPVQSAATTVSGAAPAPAPAPKPAAAPAPAPAPGAVRPESASAPQAVPGPRTGFATYPHLAAGMFSAGSGLPLLMPGSVPMPQLFPVSNVAQPLALPVTAPEAAQPSAPRAPLPAGLPLVIVLVAGTALAGTAGAHFATLRGRRGSTTA